MLMTICLVLKPVTEKGGSESVGKKDLELLKKRKKDAKESRYSQEVSHPSTNLAQRCLTWQIGRTYAKSN